MRQYLLLRRDADDCRICRRKILVVIFSLTFFTFFIRFHIPLYEVENNQIMQIKTFVNRNNDYSSLDYQENKIITKKSFKNLVLFSNFSNHKASASKNHRRLPQALIIGVRKCGTRALLEMLYLHPRIEKAAGEVHFFDRDENYEKGLEWYRKNMPPSRLDQVTIEKSPSYFVTPEVPERVRAMNSSIKLLLILREPVTRAISDYTQLRTHALSAVENSSTGGNLAVTLLRQQRIAYYQKTFDELVLKSNGEVNTNYRPIMVSIYHKYVHQWLDIFSRKQILIVSGDRLIEDPVSEIQRIEKFLGLEPKISKNNFYYNESKGFYCLRSDSSDRCLRESKGRKHPSVDPTVVAKLRAFFIEHNQKLYELLGEDLGWPEN